jgi:hypothetical protein
MASAPMLAAASTTLRAGQQYLLAIDGARNPEFGREILGRRAASARMFA